MLFFLASFTVGWINIMPIIPRRQWYRPRIWRSASPEQKHKYVTWTKTMTAGWNAVTDNWLMNITWLYIERRLCVYVGLQLSRYLMNSRAKFFIADPLFRYLLASASGIALEAAPAGSTESKSGPRNFWNLTLWSAENKKKGLHNKRVPEIKAW